MVCLMLMYAMKPYNVEIFTQDFEMVGNTSVNEETIRNYIREQEENEKLEEANK